MRLRINHVRVLDPANGVDTPNTDILVQDGRIVRIGPDLEEPAEQVLEGKGLVAGPGLIDMHVHLRDPGLTHKEDILTGAAAAAAGGFTSVCCMPNTKPCVDNTQVLLSILEKAKAASCRVYPVVCITEGMQGGKLCDFPALKQNGAVAASDDGRPVESGKTMLEGLRACMEAGLPVISHCEDLGIINGGIINKGAVSEQLGVRGMDRASEDSITAREIALAAASGTRIHIAHVSTAGSVALIRDAKRRGVMVTCETAPHYFTLTESELLSRNANFRMNPPLRTSGDKQAVLEGLIDGTIDAIVTDHAPHTPEEKADFETAPNGVIGLETSFCVSYTALVKSGSIPFSRLLSLMSASPARILGLPGGTLTPGAAADITLFDPNAVWTVDAEGFRSRSRNSPFIGRSFTGMVKHTILNGNVVYSR